MDLFSHKAKREQTGQPLAERMRPRTLAEYVGQRHLLGQGTLLERLLAQGQASRALPSLILWGPPGTGKTTLARILAEGLAARLRVVSAVQSGVKELRQEIDEARDALHQYGQRTVLFVDEIHRFHKGQQDALLPHVESGIISLIGATTENPSFEINAALLSRCRVLRLEALAEDDLRALLSRALRDEARGLGPLRAELSDEAMEKLLKEAGGDARRALSALEAAAQIAAPDGDGVRRIDGATIEQAVQRRVLLYDKGGDEHYNIISAFIKSLRGSDPDAAMYWMTRMLEAGEEPLFLLRRMVIFAGEDIGVADPQALVLAMAATDAFRLLGMPEGIFPLSELCLYLATAPKSNSALTAHGAARQAVQEAGALPVPVHLRNADHGMGRMLGYGKGYKYPHDYPAHHVQEQYLPDALQGRRFYEPSGLGHERVVAARLAIWRGEAAPTTPAEPPRRIDKEK